MPDLRALLLDAIVFGFAPNAAVAAAAFFRFRTMLPGWLIGGAFAVRAVIALLLAALPGLALSVQPPARGFVYAFGALTRILATGMWLVAAAGIVLIPRTLEELSRRSTPDRASGPAAD